MYRKNVVAVIAWNFGADSKCFKSYCRAGRLRGLGTHGWTYDERVLEKGEGRGGYKICMSGTT